MIFNDGRLKISTNKDVYNLTLVEIIEIILIFFEMILNGGMI